LIFINLASSASSLNSNPFAYVFFYGNTELNFAANTKIIEFDAPAGTYLVTFGPGYVTTSGLIAISCNNAIYKPIQYFRFNNNSTWGAGATAFFQTDSPTRFTVTAMEAFACQDNHGPFVFTRLSKYTNYQIES